MEKQFGKNLRYYRKMRRMTQTELAGRVGVAPAYVSQIESALRMPSLKVARRMASALGLELPALLGIDGDDRCADQLSDSEKLEILRRLMRSVEFDQDVRPDHVGLEAYRGSRGVYIHRNEESVVRVFMFEEDPAEEEEREYATHPGEETVYCAAGRAVVSIAGEEKALGAGESHTFPGQKMHGVRGWKGAVVISTVTPPIGPEVFGGDPQGR
jgi:transcriptional regulator with XRE-family HTH domain